MAKPVHLVMNATSGRGDAERLRDEFERELQALGCTHRIHTSGEGHGGDIAQVADTAAREAAREGGVLVAAGGDGTVNAAVNAAVAHRVPLGVVPLGTFNYFARNHGLPEDPIDALRLIARTPQAQPVPVARVRGSAHGEARCFVVNASVGIYPQLLEDREAWKARFGRSRLVAFAAGLATLLGARRSLALTRTHDGRTVHERTLTLFVGNNRLQLEQLGLPQAPLTEQGKLAVITIRETGPWALITLVALGSVRRLADADNVHAFAARSLDVRRRFAAPGRRRMKIAIDGETLTMRTPLVFEVCDEPLLLFKPAVADERDEGAFV